MTKRILITGATGNVGSATIKSLQKNAKSDYEIIAAVRDIKKAEKELGVEKINYRYFDFFDQTTVLRAIQDLDKLFLLRPPAISNVKKYIYPIIQASKAHNLDHIVFLSVNGAEKNPLLPHRKIENYILDAGLPYTFLRPSFFMQNLTTTHRAEIKYRNEIFVPAGNARFNFIDVRDIAEIAALSLTEAGHKNKAYSLLGPDALNFHEVAVILSKQLNRRISYTSPSIFQFLTQKIKEGENLEQILVMLGLYTFTRMKSSEKSNKTLNNLLSRDPIHFAQFVKDYQHEWQT